MIKIVLKHLIACLQEIESLEKKSEPTQPVQTKLDLNVSDALELAKKILAKTDNIVTKAFMQSVLDYYNLCGSLSDKQIMVIKNTYSIQKATIDS